MRLPQVTGDARPRPPISTFHLTLLVSLQLIGGSPCGLTPVSSGPRQDDQ